MIKKVYILTFYLFTVFNSNGQELPVEDKLHFKYLTIEEGLANNKVNAICQDDKGFIWIGTDEGLNRYDGYSLIPFHGYSIDTVTTISDQVFALHNDKQHNLWIGFSDRLEKYNLKTGVFTRVLYQGKDIETTRDLFEDPEGNIWICSRIGLLYYDLKTGVLHSYKEDHGEFGLRELFTGLIDHKGNLWLGTNLQGLYVIEKRSGEARQIEFTQGWHIETMYQDLFNNIWIGTGDNNLLKYNPADSSFKTYVINPLDVYTKRVRAMGEDRDGNLYIGTRGGLYRKHPDHDLFTLIAHANLSEAKLNYNSVFSLLIDKYDILWLGTFAGGVNYADLRQKEFQTIKPDNDNKKTGLNSSNVNAIEEDADGNLYFGTANGGINYYNRNTGKFTYYNQPSYKETFSNTIYCISIDQQQNVWFGMHLKGPGILNPKTGEIKFGYNEHCSGVSMNISTYSILHDSKGNTWAGTENGLFIKSPDDCFKKAEDKSGIFPDDKIYKIFEDLKGNIWIGTEELGLYVFRNHRFISFRPDKIKGTIQAIYEDTRGNLWVGGSKNGLIFIGSDTLVQYSIHQGLPNNSICGILEDNSNNLWVSTQYGLFKFFDAVNNPVQVKPNIRIFSETEDLGSKQYNASAAKKTRRGELFFGNINGVTHFNPEMITDNPRPPDVVLTRFLIVNEEVWSDIKYKGRDILHQTISYADEVKIKQSDKIFTIEFAGIHYANPKKYKYRYILENFDEQWHETDAERRYATYTNLHGGRYIFKVMAANDDGIWSTTPALITIRVIPPFTNTIWFKLIIIILSFAILLGYYLHRMKQIKMQTVTLGKLVKLRTQEIEDKNKMLMEQYVQLNETNTLLEERQTQIEEQSEELKAQKEELTEQAKTLEETNKKLNEQNSELADKQEEILQMNDELKYQTEELEKMNTKLQELNATKDKFFSIIAHDLKNPFQTINGFLELLQLKFNILSQDKIQRYIDLAYNTSKNTYNLLENLLSWARSQTNQIKYEPTPLFIHEIVQHNIAIMETTFSGKNIEILTDYDGNPKILADRNMVNTIIRNLLSNAVKFTPSDGRIKISTTEDEKYLTICIEDNGIGMTESMVRDLFNLKATHLKYGTDGETGTGLGLILCEEFVSKNGGNIWVESEPDKGSRFYFTLPKFIF